MSLSSAEPRPKDMNRGRISSRQGLQKEGNVVTQLRPTSDVRAELRSRHDREGPLRQAKMLEEAFQLRESADKEDRLHKVRFRTAQREGLS